MVIIKKDGITYCDDGLYRGFKRNDGTYIDDDTMTERFRQCAIAVRKISV